MVWSLDDFVREIRRQLVELETLRKRTRGEPGAFESLERLEQSQRYLLRKLSEYFQSVATGQSTKDEPPKELPGGTADLAPDGDEALLPDYLLAYIHSVLQQPGVLDHLGKEEANSEKIRAWLVIGVGDKGKGQDAPYLKEKCFVCGKLLVSSILAGDPVIREGETWFHKRCQEGGEFWHPFSLN